MEPWYTGFVAALLTLFDLDRVFYIPLVLRRSPAFYAWWWGFIFVNGAIAGLLLNVLSDVEALKSLPSWGRILAVGLGYRVLVGAKLATITVEGRSIPIGPEIFYEKAKEFVFKRINRIARDARVAEVAQLVGRCTLAELTNQAHAGLLQDALLTAEQKEEIRVWVTRVAGNGDISESYKRTLIATYILSGQRQ